MNDLEFVMNIYCRMSIPIIFFFKIIKRWLYMRYILNIHVNIY